MFFCTGPVELAAVGFSIAVFNQVSKIAIFPLVSITTSFVAEEDATGGLTTEDHEDAKLQGGFAVNKEMEELLPQAGILLLLFCQDDSWSLLNFSMIF
jgi:hypothetical protein